MYAEKLLLQHTIIKFLLNYKRTLVAWLNTETNFIFLTTVDFKYFLALVANIKRGKLLSALVLDTRLLIFYVFCHTFERKIVVVSCAAGSHSSMLWLITENEKKKHRFSTTWSTVPRLIDTRSLTSAQICRNSATA